MQSDSQMGKFFESGNCFWFLASGYGYRIVDSGYILEALLLAAYGRLASGVAAWLCVWRVGMLLGRAPLQTLVLIPSTTRSSQGPRPHEAKSLQLFALRFHGGLEA